jgi:hypothetical protein
LKKNIFTLPISLNEHNIFPLYQFLFILSPKDFDASGKIIHYILKLVFSNENFFLHFVEFLLNLFSWNLFPFPVEQNIILKSNPRFIIQFFFHFDVIRFFQSSTNALLLSKFYFHFFLRLINFDKFDFFIPCFLIHIKQSLQFYLGNEAKSFLYQIYL